MMRRTELSNGWTVQAYAGAGLDRGVGSLPATVPGAVHADLIAEGLIDDPLMDRNEELAAWVGHTDWRYELLLGPEDCLDEGGEPGTRLDLVFEGIDTSAVIALDDRDLLTTENMHRSYRLDANSAQPGEILSVSIESPWTAAERHRDRLGPLPNTYDTPYNFLRTMACSFGWDWGPTVPGAALWRPVFLERWSIARIAEVRPLVRVWPNGLGAVTVAIALEFAEPASSGRPLPELELIATLAGPDGREVVIRSALAPAQQTAEVTVLAEDVELWWPHTLGEPVLYEFRVALVDLDGTSLDAWERKIGFRTIELDSTPDEFGSAFTLVVNGRPVFAKGINWIPDDPFPARITPDRYADQVLEAVGLGADLLRVWGGGIYEAEAFYEACDRLGVMVWQDFAFACAAYPEEEPFASEVVAEATEAVTRLMPHPSLVLWCGNNENLWGYVDWDWAEQIEGRTWGRGFYLDVLPEIVGRIDPTRPYWAGSPWSQRATSANAPEHHLNDPHPNDPRHGCTHEWEVWNRIDLDHYRDQVPRFLSEFGWQAAPTWATLREALTDEPLTADSPGVRAHQKAVDGDLKLARGLAKHTAPQAMDRNDSVGGPAEGPDWVYRTQVVQARAVSTAVEHLRSYRGRCMGSIWWQLNDCWPSVSWAVIDKARRRKLAWFALRKSYRPRLLTVQPRETGLAAVLVNDTPTPWKTSLVAERMMVSGRSEVRDRQDCQVEVPAYDVCEVLLADTLARSDDPTREVVRVRAGESGDRAETAWWWFVPAAELDLPHPAGEVTIEPSADGLHIEVRARTHIRDLCLLPDHLHPDATVDDNLFTLADGEVANFRVRLPSHADRQMARDAVLAGQALRCLGDGPRAFRIVTPLLTAFRTGAR